ncbi:MAG TPA: LysE family transporter [Ignavibacteria bacterium]|nr:LysE family transporter [Ignavibacteria bacterium]
MIIGLVVGLVIGFLYSMPPLGPTYFAIIDRGLKKEFNNAIAIGAGAGFMDMIYILISFGGVSLISSIIPQSVDDFFIANEEKLKYYLGITGCILVILYGLNIMLKKIEPDEVGIKAEQEKLKKAKKGIIKILHVGKELDKDQSITGSFFTGVLMCLSSPTLPASWFATVGYLKSYGLIDSNFSTGVLLSIGVLIGTTFWFYIMTKLVIKHTKKMSPEFRKKLNYFTGSFLILLGVFFLIKITI